MTRTRTILVIVAALAFWLGGGQELVTNFEEVRSSIWRDPGVDVPSGLLFLFVFHGPGAGCLGSLLAWCAILLFDKIGRKTQ